MTPLGRALLTLDREMPETFRVVDARMSREAPDLVEHSVAIREGRLCPWRATYYFDGPRDGARVGEALAQLAEAASLPLPAALAEPLDDPCVLQHVVGVDDDQPARLKRYVVFRRPDRGYVEALLSRLGREAPALEAGRVYIVGLDVDASGLSGLKLYFKLDRARVGRFLSGAPELLPVLRGSREIVFGHRPGGGRRTIYFHADSPEVLEADLRRRATAGGPAARAAEHIASLTRAHAMAPWIAGVPYADDGVRRDELTLYLHPTR